MLSNGFETPLLLKLKSSRMLFIVRLAAHGLALLAISLPLNIYFVFKLLLYFIVLTSLLITILNKIKTKDRQRIFRWRDTHDWIESKNTGDVVWVCQRGAIITAWFVIVTLQRGKKRQSIFISADQCSKPLFRRLSVRLKYLTTPSQEVVASSIDSS